MFVNCTSSLGCARPCSLSFYPALSAGSWEDTKFSVRTVEHGIRFEMVTLGSGSRCCSAGSNNGSGSDSRR
jgi:hypothetical protein